MKNLIVLLAFVGTVCSVHLAVKNGTPPVYCIVMDANITGTFHYFDLVANKTVESKFEINDNSSAKATGNCNFVYGNKTAQSIFISFVPDVTPPPAAPLPLTPWNLTIIFHKKNDDATEHSFVIADYSLEVVLSNVTLEGGDKTFKKADGAEMEWGAEEDRGFSCSSTGLSFTDDTSVQFKNLKVIAFAASKNDSFTDAGFEQCKLDIRTSDVVPIVVGACLAGLVVVVLIAYLIGRARAKRQGYASV